MKFYEYLKGKNNRGALSFIVAVVFAGLAGLWAVITYIDSRESGASLKNSDASPSTPNVEVNVVQNATQTNTGQASPLSQQNDLKYHGEGIDVIFRGTKPSTNTFDRNFPNLAFEFVSFATKRVQIDSVVCHFNNWSVPDTSPPKVLNTSMHIFPQGYITVELDPEQRRTAVYELSPPLESGEYSSSELTSCQIKYFIFLNSSYVETRRTRVLLGH